MACAREAGRGRARSSGVQHVWLDWIITIPALAVATVFVVRKAMTATWLQPDPELARKLINRGVPLIGDPEFRTWQVDPVRTWVLRAAWVVCALGCARALNAFVALALGS